MKKIANFLASLVGKLFKSQVIFWFSLNHWQNQQVTEKILQQLIGQIQELGLRYGDSELSTKTQSQLWSQVIETAEPIVFQQREAERKKVQNMLRIASRAYKHLAKKVEEAGDFDVLTTQKISEQTYVDLKKIQAQLEKNEDIQTNFANIRKKIVSHRFVYPSFTTEDSVYYHELCHKMKTVFQFQLKILFNLDEVYDYSLSRKLNENDIFLLGQNLLSVTDGN